MKPRLTSCLGALCKTPLALPPIPRARPVPQDPAPRPASGPPSTTKPRPSTHPVPPLGPAQHGKAPPLRTAQRDKAPPPGPPPRRPSPVPRPRRPFQAGWHPANSSGTSAALAARGPPAPARAGERRRSRCCASSGALAPSLDCARPEGVRSRRPRRGVPGGSRGAEPSGGAGAPGVLWRPRRLGRRRCGMLEASGELRVGRKGKPALVGASSCPPPHKRGVDSVHLSFPPTPSALRWVSRALGPTG